MVKSRIYTVLLVSFFCFSLMAIAVTQAIATQPDEVKNYAGKIKPMTFQNKDNLKIFGQYWVPEGDIKAVVLLIHGTAFHCGLYDDAGKYLSSNGYVVCGTDLQGWGQSQGKGKNGYISSYDEYVDDISIVMKSLREEYPEKKIFVLGENFGAIIPLYGQIKNEFYFDGFIFSGAFHKPNPKVIFRMPGFAANMVRAVGGIGASMMPKKLPAVPADIGISLAVTDKEIENNIKNDPYVTRGLLPVSWANSLLKADKFIDPKLSSISQPTLLLHGQKDGLVPLASAEDLLNKISSKDKELKIISESGNAVLLDHSKYDALKDIIVWLDKRS